MEISDNSADVIKLPVKRKHPNGQLMLVAPPTNKCKHYLNSFEVDATAGECTCLACGEKVSPFFVLMRLMDKESLWMRNRESYNAEHKRLSERTRTKCQHCGEMTRISGR
jgi:hypothetical protein